MVAFMGAVTAFPSLAMAAMCALDISLFVYMAFDDERVLLSSGLAADYQIYRRRVRMFLPRVA